MKSQDSTARDYGELIAALIARRKALGLTQGDVDYISGLQEGYTAKIESWRHRTSGRGLGILTLPLLLQALKVELVVRPTGGRVLKHECINPEGLPHEHHWVRVAPKRSRQV